ncbi:MAG: hypothetical protein V3R37_07795 [Rhodospirillales bacterium]
MKIARTLFTAASWFVFAGALSSCAGLPYALPGERAAELPVSDGLVEFRADAVGDKAAKRIQYSDNEQRVDYALFKGAGGQKASQAEFVYMEVPYNTWTAFNYPFTIRDKVEAWNLSKGQPAAWEKPRFLSTRMGEVFLRPYQLTTLGRQCFGVSGEWDMAGEDPELRYTRILFGYFCARPGKAMSIDEMVALADKIGVRGVSEHAVDFADVVWNFHQDVAQNFKGRAGTLKAIELAQGINREAGGKMGISEFPFRYAEQYDPGGDRPDLP